MKNIPWSKNTRCKRKLNDNQLSTTPQENICNRQHTSTTLSANKVISHNTKQTNILNEGTRHILINNSIATVLLRCCGRGRWQKEVGEPRRRRKTHPGFFATLNGNEKDNQPPLTMIVRYNMWYTYEKYGLSVNRDRNDLRVTSPLCHLRSIIESSQPLRSSQLRINLKLPHEKNERRVNST